MELTKLLEAFSLVSTWEGKERCGIVMETGEVIEFPNVSKTVDSFAFSADELHREGAWATWHTHPDGLHNLSGADYNTFLITPHLRHFVLTSTSTMCFKVEHKTLLVIDHDYTQIKRVS